TAPAIAELQVGREDAGAAVERHFDVLRVDVEDPVGEGVDELHGVDLLPQEVTRVEVEAEGGVMADRLEGPLCRVQVEGDLARVHLEGEFHALRLEDVED